MTLNIKIKLAENDKQISYTNRISDFLNPGMLYHSKRIRKVLFAPHTLMTFKSTFMIQYLYDHITNYSTFILQSNKRTILIK